jgi:Spy/CpxP family protein refolding chaperone
MFEFTHGILLARRKLVLAGLLVAGCCALWSQADAPQGPPPGPPQAGMHDRGRGPERELRELTHVLNLTDAQREQVKALLDERRQQMQALRNPAAADPAAETPRPSRQQMEQIRQATDSRIAGVLNDDQKAKFAAWQKQRQERMEHRGGPGEGGPPPPPQGD